MDTDGAGVPSNNVQKAVDPSVGLGMEIKREIVPLSGIKPRRQSLH
jgi:hypothetical protein